MMNYEIQDYLDSYLREALIANKYVMYRRLFNLLFNLNTTIKNNNHIELDDLQGEMIDTITVYEDDTDSVNLHLEVVFTKAMKTYIGRYGIIISDDATLSDYEAILLGYYNLINPDPNMIEYIQMQLEDIEYEDNLLKLASILSMNSTKSVTSVYEVLDDVREDIFILLATYFSNMLDVNGEPLTDNTIDIVLALTKADPGFNNTFILKDVIINGYRAVGIDMLLTDLYSNINKHTNDYNLIPYEIVATLYIANDTKDDMLSGYLEKFNMEALVFMQNESGKEVINAAVEMLINKIYASLT